MPPPVTSSYIELPPVITAYGEFEEIEKRIKEAFRELLYRPILRILGAPESKLRVTNAKSNYASLIEQLRSGKIAFYRGKFSGAFNAASSRELRNLGAKWDRKTSTWGLPAAALPSEVRTAVSASDAAFQRQLGAVDTQLGKILPEEIAGSIKTGELFDSSLWKTSRQLAKTLKSLTVIPELTPEGASRVSAEWQENLDKWIKDFAAEEITRLRSEIKESVFTGNRFESAVSTIQKSYGVSARKAKFLARQETNLLLSKFKEVRYSEAGIREYKWRCVAGSKSHPVRPSHKALDGKIFRWDSPPITTSPSEPVRRNHPGEDFNCRCTAVPVVKFK